jgi:glycosyltransferase involved in cell wall biosynthesis
VTAQIQIDVSTCNKAPDSFRGRGEAGETTAPLVTITFVAWMRRELLRKGIESALALDYQPIEILIVDNSASDDIYRWIEQAYPTVKSIKTFSPLPLPMVRNMLVASARGKYVVFHDDDSRFAETKGLSLAVEYFERNPHVACLAFRQGNERGEWNPQFDGPSICPTYTYIACAVMFRRSDYLQAGGYFEKFPLYGEELILSLGYFGLGKEIHYYPHVPIIHEQVMQGRWRDPGKRYHLADIVMTPGAMLLKAPLPDICLWYPLLLLWCAVKVAFFQRRPIVALHGLVDALLWMPTFLRERRAIPRSQFHRWTDTRKRYQRSGTCERVRG